MKNSRRNDNTTITGPGRNALLPALAIVGGTLVALPASALELADLKVHSSIGQPLRASIAYALAPSESLASTCVSLSSASPAGLPALSTASINVADGVIFLSGKTAVREPLMTIRLNVNCPYTPQLSREYMAFIDPAGSQPAEPVPVSIRPTALVPARRAPTSSTVARTAPRSAAPIPAGSGTRYQVQAGDSLSEIVQRIENRSVALWPAVNAIFAANPDAFLNNDPNRLKSGAWLSIPDLGAGTVSVAAAAPATDAPSAAPQPVAVDTDTAVDVAVALPDDGQSAGESGTTNMSAVVDSNNAVVDDNPFVTPAGSSAEVVSIPDTALEGPKTASESPNVTTATLQSAPVAEQPSTTNWLLWFVGGGIALIASMLMFGRLFRGRRDAAPDVVMPIPQRDEVITERRKSVRPVDTIEVEELHVADDDPTAENLALDADLVMGTGLQTGNHEKLGDDFGFAAATDLDLELPEEMSSGSPIDATDMIPPLGAVEIDSILESEVLPEDDYDMSVVVDATKMPMPDDVTQQDLEAVRVEPVDDTLMTDEYTVSQEVDYSILEQDYEDELTATQALNQEIAKAAAELAEDMDDTDDDTREISMANVHQLDVTAQLPAKNDEVAGLDDTSIDEQTAILSADDKTVEMEAREDDTDSTANMEIESGKIDTKAG